MDAQTWVYVFCVEAIIYLLLYNSHDSTFKIYQKKYSDFFYCYTGLGAGCSRKKQLTS